MFIPEFCTRIVQAKPYFPANMKKRNSNTVNGSDLLDPNAVVLAETEVVRSNLVIPFQLNKQLVVAPT